MIAEKNQRWSEREKNSFTQMDAD